MAKNNVDKTPLIVPAETIVDKAEKVIADAQVMTAEKALDILMAAIKAVTYLEEKAQGSANRDADDMALIRAKRENVDGTKFALSWKEKTKESKAIKALNNSIVFAKLVRDAEAKPIETTATKAPALLS